MNENQNLEEELDLAEKEATKATIYWSEAYDELRVKMRKYRDTIIHEVDKAHDLHTKAWDKVEKLRELMNKDL